MPEEVNDIIKDIPVGKLQARLPLGDLKRLTIEQARKVREELMKEE